MFTSQSIPPVGAPNGTTVASVVNVISVDFTDNGVPPGTPPGLTGQQMVLSLTAGTIFQRSGGCNGGNVAPCDADKVDIAANVAFDSFVAFGGLTSETTVGGTSRNVLPSGMGNAVFSTTAVNVVWAVTGFTAPPTKGFITAQITLTQDAQGTWSYFGSTADGTGRSYMNLPIVNGVMVPEPAALSLLGLAIIGPLGIARRRG